MNKTKIFLFLSVVVFGCYAFAEGNSVDKPVPKPSASNTYLAVKDVHSDGLVLVLNDGSEWNIEYFGGGLTFLGWGWKEQREVSHWAVGDAIEIQYPGSGNFNDFLLLITNGSKKEEAMARLKQAPSGVYSDSLWVAHYDNETNCVCLSDGTTWFRTNTDMYGAFSSYKPHSLRNWESGDTVTLLRGEGWFAKNTFFLWNHVTNEMPVVNRVQ